MDGTPSKIDLKFIALVKARKFAEARAMMGQVEDINVRDQKTGAAALHFAAVYHAHSFLAHLETRPDLNYCVRDKRNKAPSEVAWVGAANEILGAELLRKEVDYARRHGIDWRPHP